MKKTTIPVSERAVPCYHAKFKALLGCLKCGNVCYQYAGVESEYADVNVEVASVQRGFISGYLNSFTLPCKKCKSPMDLLGSYPMPKEEEK